MARGKAGYVTENDPCNFNLHSKHPRLVSPSAGMRRPKFSPRSALWPSQRKRLPNKVTGTQLSRVCFRLRFCPLTSSGTWSEVTQQRHCSLPKAESNFGILDTVFFLATLTNKTFFLLASATRCKARPQCRAGELSKSCADGPRPIRGRCAQRATCSPLGSHVD